MLREDCLNLLEPAHLVHAFMDEPPEGFTALWLMPQGKAMPAFLASYDILTTMEEKTKKILRPLQPLLPRMRTLFTGTTVTEYSLFPKDVHVAEICQCIITKAKETGASLAVVKDIPLNSPLLSDEERHYAASLMDSLRQQGFLILEGQALAYVPVTVESRDEYLKCLSRARRKDLRRKLRAFGKVTVEAVPTGSISLDETMRELFYRLYEEVYAQSSIHFDKLTRSFFARVLGNPQEGGVLFVYRSSEGIIGFNLCFVHGPCLVDKYVGFRYPQAREHNLYFLSWFHNIDYCIEKGLNTFVAGWTDPQIKQYLGARCAYTVHGVYVRNPVLRKALSLMKPFFEADRRTLESRVKVKKQ